MGVKRMDLGSGGQSKSSSTDKQRPYTKYACIWTTYLASHGISGSSRIIPEALTVLHLRGATGYADDKSFMYMTGDEMLQYPELKPGIFEMHRCPKGTRYLGRKRFTDEEYFFQDFEIIPDASGVPTGACTAIDFTPEADFIRFTLSAPNRKFSFYCGGEFLATVTMDEFGDVYERTLELLFIFKDGKCVEIENNTGASDGAVYAKFETELPVKLVK